MEVFEERRKIHLTKAIMPKSFPSISMSHDLILTNSIFLHNPTIFKIKLQIFYFKISNNKCLVAK